MILSDFWGMIIMAFCCIIFIAGIIISDMAEDELMWYDLKRDGEKDG